MSEFTSRISEGDLTAQYVQINAGELRMPTSVSIENIDTLGYCPDLDRLVEAIHGETGTLLQATRESMEGSFLNRKAVTLMDGIDAVGYVRFSPLLDDDKKRQLGIREDFPDIYETGTAIILPEHRGNHYYPRLRTSLLSLCANEMREGRLLVLGTTKTPKVIESLDDSSELGLEIEIVDFMDVEKISAHTCVCDGDFGNGFQNGRNCSKRATKEDLIQIAQHDWKGLQARGRMIDGKIPCTLYLSGTELAKNMDEELRNGFGSLEDLVQALRGVGHYD